MVISESRYLKAIHCENCKNMIAPTVITLHATGAALISTAKEIHRLFCEKNRVICASPKITVFTEVTYTEEENEPTEKEISH